MATPIAPTPTITTPEELAELFKPKAQVKKTTPMPATLQGPQGELLTGMPPAKPEGPPTAVPPGLQGPQGELLTGAPPAGPPTPVPAELQGPQGELLTGMPQEIAAAKEAKAAAPPPEAPAPAPGLTDTPPAVAARKEAEMALSNLVAPKTEGGKAKKPKGEFWKKLGTLAKNTGRTVAELLQAAMFGYTGNTAPLAYQTRQAGEREAAAKEADRAFEQRMDQINREWQAAQFQARDANELEREKMRLSMQAQQAQLDRASAEKIAGARSGAPGAGGENPWPAIIEQLKAGGGGKK